MPPLDALTTPRHEVAWLAGLLEGEGWFGEGTVQYQATDADIADRVHEMMGGKFNITERSVCPSGREGKTIYRVSCHGQHARAVMEAILPYMGARRTTKIQTLLTDSTWGFPSSQSEGRMRGALAGGKSSHEAYVKRIVQEEV